MSDEPGVSGLPVCSLSPSRREEGELDLDSVHMLLRSFQQELRDTERERDEAQAQDEAVQRGELQNRIMSEELAKMKNSQQITEAEAKALQEKLECYQTSEESLEVELRHMKETCEGHGSSSCQAGTHTLGVGGRAAACPALSHRDGVGGQLTAGTP